MVGRGSKGPGLLAGGVAAAATIREERATGSAEWLPTPQRPAESAVSDHGKRSLRIALLGQFGVGNFGNDGSLEAMIRTLSRICPKAELTVICTEPKVVAETFGINTIKLTRRGIKQPWLDRANRLLGRLPYKLYGPVRAFRKLACFDIVVLPGTGAFDDFGDTPFGMPYVFFKWLAMARLRGCAIAFVSIGAGPAYHYLSRLFFSGASRCATYRSFRDAISRDFVSSLGVDTSADEVFPDLAFSLPVPPPLARYPGAPLIVGLGVMNYRGRTGEGQRIYEAYIAKLAEFVELVLGRGFAVRLMLGQDNDHVAVVDLMARLRPKLSEAELARVLYEPASSLHHVMAQMQATDVIVATRFHNVVCALRVGIPVISLGYLEKHDVLAADMGLADYCADVEQFQVEWLISRLEGLLEERDARAAQVRATVARYLAELSEQETILLEQVLHLPERKRGLA